MAFISDLLQSCSNKSDRYGHDIQLFQLRLSTSKAVKSNTSGKAAGNRFENSLIC
jgi:hypothetical protein